MTSTTQGSAVQVVEDKLPKVLNDADNYNPPYLRQPPDTPLHQFSGPIPFNFYDRHLDDALALKRVVPLTALPKHLSQKVDHVFDDLKKHGLSPLPLNGYTRHYVASLEPPETSAERITMSTLADGYALSIGIFCPALASTWTIHPRTSTYKSAFVFDHHSSRIPKDVEGVYPFYSARLSPFHTLHNEILSSVDEQTKAALKGLAGRDLFTCLFFPMSPDMDEVFAEMDQLSTSFPSSAYTTTNFPTPPNPSMKVPPFDASSAPWVLPKLPPVSQVKFPTTKNRTVEPKRVETPWFSSTITAGGIVHNAWHRAVQEDTTIIVFNCGNYERIGIRHRASQTLFLSDLIQVWDCKNPSYGRLHLGLFCSAISDTFDRFQQTYQQPLDNPIPPTLKRPREPDEPHHSRRSTRIKLMTRTSGIKRPTNRTKNSKRTAFLKALTPRTLALVSIKYQHFNSPVPAPCLRMGGMLSPEGVCGNVRRWKSSYEQSEQCSLTLLSDLSEGGTGRVHVARMEIVTEDGVSLTEDVVVKAAAEPSLQARVRQEYRVYRRLWEHGVQRIPLVYGLYEDIDNMVTFLVLEKLEMSFRDREPINEEGGGVLLTGVSHAERSLCLKTVRAIHQAGVIHRDLRPDNILFAPDGKPMIVDFDRARRNPTPEQMKREIEDFRRLLDGKLEGSLMFSTGDFQSDSESESESESESQHSDHPSEDKEGSEE
ncbi:hypothetical protein BDN72DRAFT_957679 [Pluteus cervinus]|uniref:Uncharacterized protein n=1 Tax=Pluteus cervinus TaxID=181527 RepID=A0ACD3B1Q5_9AGAR|nr:hypothetical protein BDN72DRAFT_957679 [Pluteus cervinus]